METEPNTSAETHTATIVTEAGWIVDTETGECLGHVDIATETTGSTDFHVTDAASADWVMEKLHAVDWEIQGEADRLASIAANIEKLMERKRKRREWLMGRFAAELELYAQNALMGGKKRTLSTPFGDMKFRASAGGSITAKDTTAAIEWARGHCPDAVVTTPRLVVTPLKVMADKLPQDIFEISEPSERFTIETGVKAR